MHKQQWFNSFTKSWETFLFVEVVGSSTLHIECGTPSLHHLRDREAAVRRTWSRRDCGPQQTTTILKQMHTIMNHTLPLTQFM